MDKKSDIALDRLLGEDFLDVPPDFTLRVLQRAEQQEPVAVSEPLLANPGRVCRLISTLRWLGMIGGGALAFGELLGFIFGLWSVSQAF